MSKRKFLTFTFVLKYGLNNILVDCKKHKAQGVTTLEAPNILVLKCGCRVEVPR